MARGQFAEHDYAQRDHSSEHKLDEHDARRRRSRYAELIVTRLACYDH
jgi:hypothetical protein